MSYLPATAGRDLWVVLGVIGAVAGLAWWMRRSGRDSAESAQLSDPMRPDDPEPRGDDADDFDRPDGESAAVTMDGLAFIGDPHGVILASVPSPGPRDPHAQEGRELLRPGDFTAARVVRGAPGVDPWRLELLGRDGEYVSFGFATDEAAACALTLVETRGVVRTARDEDGRPLRASAEQFAEARRIHDETERELANMPEEPPPEEWR